MTREEVIEYWEQFNDEIDDLYDACSDADRDVLVKQREIVEYTISALRQQEHFRDLTKMIKLLSLSVLFCEIFTIIIIECRHSVHFGILIATTKCNRIFDLIVKISLVKFTFTATIFHFLILTFCCIWFCTCQ